MAQALKVGDRVRVAERHPNLIGREFVIEEVGGSGVTARFPGHPTRFIHFNALEKIDPEPKFQIGDRVRRDDGVEGVVVHVRPNYFDDQRNLHPFLLRMNTSKRDEFEHRFEKVEPVPFKLERGDKVVNVKTGRKGVVIYDMVYDDQPPFGAPVPVGAIEEYEEHHPGTYDLIKKDAPW